LNCEQDEIAFHMLYRLDIYIEDIAGPTSQLQ